MVSCARKGALRCYRGREQVRFLEEKAFVSSSSAIMRKRLKLASLAANPALTEELPGDVAGMDGEEYFVRMMEKKTGARIYRELRVPDCSSSRGGASSEGAEKPRGVTSGGGRFEIDVVLASRSSLIIVEVKNW